MQSKSQRLKELVPDVELSFLPTRWDKFILGLAFRAKTLPLPVYGYNAMKAFLEQVGLNPQVLFKEINKILYSNVYPAPILLRSFTPIGLHDEIKVRDLPVWQDHLTLALLGTAMRQKQPVAACYDYNKTIEEIAKTQVESTDINPKVTAMDFLENRIIPVWLGESTPYFVQLID